MGLENIPDSHRFNKATGCSAQLSLFMNVRLQFMTIKQGSIYELKYIDLEISKEVMSIQKFSMEELDSKLGIQAI